MYHIIQLAVGVGICHASVCYVLANNKYLGAHDRLEQGSSIILYIMQ